MKTRTRRTNRWSAIAAVVVVVAVLTMVSGCPDGSLLGLVGENGELSADADLSSLTVSEGELIPAFDPATTEYTVSLDSAHTTVVVTGTPADSRATVCDNSGAGQGLESGANPITINVTAEDETTTKAYVVTVNRGAVGEVDTTFDPGGGVNGTVLAVAIQPDGRIVIGGAFDRVDGIVRNYVARLNADGSVDSTFEPGAGANDTVRALVVQGDGRIVIGGQFTSVGGAARSGIARLNADGSLDTSFSADANQTVRALAMQSSGQIVIGGQFTTVHGVPRANIARLNSDGSLDADFDPGDGGWVRAVAVQSDDRVVIGGDFSTVEGEARRYIARLNADGSVDHTFNPGSGADESVYAVAVQSDGRIVIGGDIYEVDGAPYNRVARLNANGSPDTTFDPGSGPNRLPEALAMQSDGRIVLGGNFSTVDGVTRNRIARLNSDGSLNGSFDPGLGANGSVNALAVQADGKVVMGGAFISVDGVTRNRIARLR